MSRNKWEKIQYLKDLGLNVPHCMYIPKRTEFSLGKLLSFLESQWDRVSIRTFGGKEEFLSPFFRNITLEEAKKKIGDLIFNYNLLICKGVDNSSLLYAGAVWIKELERKALIEFVEGPDKCVRDIEGSVHRLELSFWEKPRQEYFSEILRVARKKELKDLILEWGYYMKEVGILNKKLIWWGWR